MATKKRNPDTEPLKTLKELMPLLSEYQKDIERTKIAGNVLNAIIRRPDYVRGPVSQTDAIKEAVAITDELFTELKK